MIFVLSIAALFIGISIYFYFRAEGLQRALFNAKREFSNTKKENKAYIDTMALIAKRHEDFAKYRLQKMKNCRLHYTKKYILQHFFNKLDPTFAMFPQKVYRKEEFGPQVGNRPPPSEGGADHPSGHCPPG